MTIEQGPKKWWSKKVPMSIAIASIFTAGGVGAVKIIEQYAHAEINKYENDRDIAELESKSLATGYNRIQSEMRLVARDISGNQELELFCANPDGDDEMRWGVHRRKVFNKASYIIIDSFLCGTMQLVTNVDFNPEIRDPEGKIQAAAALGSFAFAHEVGHELGGSSENKANCYATELYAGISESLGMPPLVIEAPISKPSDCD